MPPPLLTKQTNYTHVYPSNIPRGHPLYGVCVSVCVCACTENRNTHTYTTHTYTLVHASSSVTAAQKEGEQRSAVAVSPVQPAQRRQLCVSENRFSALARLLPARRRPRVPEAKSIGRRSADTTAAYHIICVCVGFNRKFVWSISRSTRCIRAYAGQYKPLPQTV